MNGSFWKPLPPDGYTALITEVVVPGPLIWNDQGSGALDNVAIYAMGFLNVIFAYPSYGGIYFAVPILVPTLN